MKHFIRIADLFHKTGIPCICIYFFTKPRLTYLNQPGLFEKISQRRNFPRLNLNTKCGFLGNGTIVFSSMNCCLPFEWSPFIRKTAVARQSHAVKTKYLISCTSWRVGLIRAAGAVIIATGTAHELVKSNKYVISVLGKQDYFKTYLPILCSSHHPVIFKTKSFTSKLETLLYSLQFSLQPKLQFNCYISVTQQVQGHNCDVISTSGKIQIYERGKRFAGIFWGFCMWNIWKFSARGKTLIVVLSKELSFETLTLERCSEVKTSSSKLKECNVF